MRLGPCGKARPFLLKEVVMCGYACTNCGRCRGEAPKFVVAQNDIPGYCSECGELNRPSATVCKRCGATLGNSVALRQKRAER